ncbi:Prolyl 4-hydroxylase, alpha subunit [Metarhizium album ARSEF 1941]|uniref:Prolyl 4-hydroxylase, alpha subunit n=1 Tax=Metarhizium album (strain ARSEF 1941) TaxID=1081103 RepID=A0A0B2WZF5_METAS|nr:Prolyl 4-hydroxylase, alpha subunit [Metarhizium album ARSEF 1941]KHN98787.1 Prolyl 4-hydroxylase, alpha subunit [Metarhizium album ARSEF 1941]
MPKPKAAKPPRGPHAASTPAKADSLPAWPQFKPPLPVVELTPELHPSTPKIATIASFFPKSLCREYVTFFKTLPLQTTPGRPKRGEAVRVNDRFQVDDAVFASRLWESTGLKEALVGNEDARSLWGGEPVGLNPNIRVYRYSKGQYFDCHYDDSSNLILNAELPVPVRTTWTLLLYLTSSAEGCVGGETVFYPNDRKLRSEEIAVSLETGTLLLHKHGDDCLLHEGREVKAGEKWVLRTDLCVKR